jgi:hypothetical protein
MRSWPILSRSRWHESPPRLRAATRRDGGYFHVGGLDIKRTLKYKTRSAIRGPRSWSAT